MVDATVRYANCLEHLEKTRKLVERLPRSATPRPAAATRTRFRLLDRLDESSIQSLINDYEGGTPTQELRERYGVGRTAMTELLRGRGVKIRTQRHPNDREIKLTIELYGQGWSLNRVGERLGFDGATIARILKTAGIPLRPRRGWKYD